MPFGRKARSVRAFEYGCLLPTEGRNAAVEQMRQRVDLWNNLVELDHRYDEMREAVITPYVTAEDKEERKAQRKAAFRCDDVKAQLQALEKAEYEEARSLWLNSGLYWGNYEEVKLAWQQAKKQPGQLRFHSWHYENGKVSVRWQHGLPVAEAFSGENRLLRLAPVPPEAYTSPVRAERHKLARSTVSIRVASEGRQPVWLTLPCVLHRPLPSDGLIRSASIKRMRIGRRYHWKLILIVEMFTPAEKPTVSDSAIAIKLAWTRKPEGICVAHWLNDASESGEVILPTSWLSEMNKVDDIQSIRKYHFNQIIAVLKVWLTGRCIPEWLSAATAHLSLWRSETKLHLLVRHWQRNRFDGDDEAVNQLTEWAKRDLHLWDYQANLRDQLLKHRREIYRIFSSELARRYSRLLLDDVNITKLARVAKGSDTDYIPDAVRHNRQMAAPSELRLCVLNAATKRGLQIEKLNKEEVAAWLKKEE